METGAILPAICNRSTPVDGNPIPLTSRMVPETAAVVAVPNVFVTPVMVGTGGGGGGGGSVISRLTTPLKVYLRPLASVLLPVAPPRAHN